FVLLAVPIGLLAVLVALSTMNRKTTGQILQSCDNLDKAYKGISETQTSIANNIEIILKNTIENSNKIDSIDTLIDSRIRVLASSHSKEVSKLADVVRNLPARNGPIPEEFQRLQTEKMQLKTV